MGKKKGGDSERKQGKWGRRREETVRGNRGNGEERKRTGNCMHSGEKKGGKHTHKG